uniref:Heat shock protein n=1 Tax=Globodera pallida TaxID=36090 RepID=A0A183CSL0_GLOPA
MRLKVQPPSPTVEDVLGLLSDQTVVMDAYRNTWKQEVEDHNETKHQLKRMSDEQEERKNDAQKRHKREEFNECNAVGIDLGTTHSCVGVFQHGRMGMIPSNTVFDAKRLIGRSFDDAAVQSDILRWPFKVVKAGDGRPKVQFKVEGEDKTFFPEEISSMVLAKMKETTE